MGSGCHCVALALAAQGRTNVACLDSGASHHMIADRTAFASYTASRFNIELADGKTMTCEGLGKVIVKCLSGQPAEFNFLHVPGLVGTLISNGRLYRKGYYVTPPNGQSNKFQVTNNKSSLLDGFLKGDVFVVNFEIMRKGRPS